MIRMLTQAAVLAVAGLALGACQMEQAKTAAPAKKAPVKRRKRKAAAKK